MPSPPTPGYHRVITCWLRSYLVPSSQFQTSSAYVGVGHNSFPCSCRIHARPAHCGFAPKASRKSLLSPLDFLLDSSPIYVRPTQHNCHFDSFKVCYRDSNSFCKIPWLLPVLSRFIVSSLPCTCLLLNWL